MIKTQLSLQEIGAIEICLRIVNDSIDRGDIEDLTSGLSLVDIMEHYSNATIENLIKWCEEFD